MHTKKCTSLIYFKTFLSLTARRMDGGGDLNRTILDFPVQRNADPPPPSPSKVTKNADPSPGIFNGKDLHSDSSHQNWPIF